MKTTKEKEERRKEEIKTKIIIIIKKKKIAIQFVLFLMAIFSIETTTLSTKEAREIIRILGPLQDKVFFLGSNYPLPRERSKNKTKHTHTK